MLFLAAYLLVSSQIGQAGNQSWELRTLSSSEALSLKLSVMTSGAWWDLHPFSFPCLTFATPGRWSLSRRCRCRPRCMHFPVVHPGTLTDKDERQNGRPQVYSIPHPSSINNSRQYSVLMITLGQVIAYAIGAGFFHVKSGWRWMVGLGAVPAGIQFFLLFFLPESRTFITHFPAPML